MVVGSLVGENFYDPSAEEWQPITVDMMNTPLEMNVMQFSGEMPTTREIKLNISALLAPNNMYDYQILMPLQDVIKWNEWTTGQEIEPDTFRYDRIVVRATSRETANDVTQAIRDLGYSTAGIGDYLNQLNRFFGTMRLMLGGVGGVALLVAAFGVANTMTMAILGAHQRDRPDESHRRDRSRRADRVPDRSGAGGPIRWAGGPGILDAAAQPDQ